MYKAILQSLLISLIIVGSLSAEESPPNSLEPVPDTPPIPEQVQDDQPMEPEVTIVQKRDRTIEEYRVNTRLYMVKVTPVIGPSYYLVDQDGDGRLESNMSQLYSDWVIPQWVLVSW